MKFAYSGPDGSVRIVIAAPKSDLEKLFGPLSNEQYEAHVVERSRPADANDWVRLPDDWVAPDRAQRASWRLRDGKVVIEPAKTEA